MDYEDELEQLQKEAMAEMESDNDTDQDDNQQEESIDRTDDTEENADDREDFERDEREDDSESDEDIDEEDFDDDQDNDDDEINDTDSNNETNQNDFDPIEVTVNGQNISINTKEEMLAFIKKGASSMGNKPSRKSTNDQIVEQGKLSQDDLKLLIDAKNGDKKAIAKLAKDSNIDIYDLGDDDAVNYKATFNPTLRTEMDDIADDIIADNDWHDSFKKASNAVPPDFLNEIASNPSALRNFSNQVKSGLAQRIIPEAIKASMLNSDSFMNNYAKIGQRIYNEDQADPVEKKNVRKKDPRADKLRERAKNSKGSNKGTKTKITGDDIWDMSDEEFNKKYM